MRVRRDSQCTPPKKRGKTAYLDARLVVSGYVAFVASCAFLFVELTFPEPEGFVEPVVALVRSGKLDRHCQSPALGKRRVGSPQPIALCIEGYPSPVLRLYHSAIVLLAEMLAGSRIAACLYEEVSAIDREEGHPDFTMYRFALYCSDSVYDEGPLPVVGRDEGFFAWSGLQVKVKGMFKSTVSSCPEILRSADCLRHLHKDRWTTPVG